MGWKFSFVRARKLKTRSNMYDVQQASLHGMKGPGWAGTGQAGHKAIKLTRGKQASLRHSSTGGEFLEGVYGVGNGEG